MTVRGDTAWFDGDLATPNWPRPRGSGVLVWERKAWRIAHYNLTITIPNERMKEIKTLLRQPNPARAPPADR